MSLRADPSNGLSAFVLTGLLLASAQTALGSTMIAVALPAIGAYLGESLASVTALLVTPYLVVAIVAQAPGGKLGDVLGHGRCARLGMVVFAAGAIGATLAQDIASLAAARCVMALGGALIAPATLALLRIHVAPHAHGRVFGLVAATAGLAAAIGPPLAGELVAQLDWRAIFYVSLPFLVASLILVRPIDPTSSARPSWRTLGGDFDWGGVLLLALGFGALIAATRLDDSARLAALAYGLGTLGLFALWETHRADPIVRPGLFANRVYGAGTAIVALQTLAMYGLLLQLPIFFSQHRVSSPRAIGLMLLVMMLALFAASIAGGRLSDWLGARRTALAGAALLWAGALWLTQLAQFAAPADAMPALLLLGVGLGLCSVPAQASAMAAVEHGDAGMAAGAMSSLRYGGGAAGTLALSAMLGDSVAPLAAHEMAAWIFAGAVGLSGLLCVLLPGGTSTISRADLPP